MALQLERRLFTLEEYERMIDAGVFHADERLELIRGAIIAMTPLNHLHEACVVRLTRQFFLLTEGHAVVWPQGNSLRIPDRSRPEPDLTLLRWRTDLYAAGSPALIVNLPDQMIEVYANPVEGTYRRTRRAKRGDTLALPAPLQGMVAARDILGPAREMVP